MDAFDNRVDLSFSVPGSAPTTLDTPILVVHNYIGAASPTQVLLDGAALTADSDYFISLRPSAAELWVTLNRKLAGTHTFQITGAAAAYRLYLPLVIR